MTRGCRRGGALPARDSTAPSCTVGSLSSGLVPASASLSTQSGTGMPCALGTWVAAGAARPEGAAGSVTWELAPAGPAWSPPWSAGDLNTAAWPLDGESNCFTMSVRRSALLCSSSRPALSRPGSWLGADAEAVVENACAPRKCQEVRPR